MDVLDKLLFNLETLANISRGQRISTSKEFIVIDNDSPMQGFWRWKHAESRNKTILIICKEVRTVIFIAMCIIESKYILCNEHSINDPGFALLRNERINKLKNIQIGLSYAFSGINNICLTYEDDADVNGRLRPLLNEIIECTILLSKINIQ